VNKREGRRQGKLFRDEAVDRVLANERSEWKAAVGAIMDTLIESGKPFDGDDVQACARDQGLPPPHAPQCWGAMMRNAAASSRITMMDTVPAATPSSKASMIGKWIKAPPVEWLA
jgi:hypothetical protein